MSEVGVKWRSIYGLYGEGWGDRLCPEAFAHPAKCRPAVARAIFEHALKTGWWKKGEVLLDVFAGVGGFLLAGAWAGLQMVGVELERHFWQMAGGCDCAGVTKAHWVRYHARGQADKLTYRDGHDVCPTCRGLAYKRDSGIIPCSEPHRYGGNVGLHERVWGPECPRPVILCGDSRNLAALLGAAAGLAEKGKDAGCGRGKGVWDAYGATSGNLGNLRPGSVEGAVSSPPFGSTEVMTGESKGFHSYDANEAMNRCKRDYIAQDSPGNLAALPMGAGINTDSMPYPDFDGRLRGIACSPPYAQSLQNPGGSRTPNAPEGFKLGRSTAGVVSSPPYAAITPGQGGLNTLPPREGSNDQTGRAKGPSQIGGLVTSSPYSNALTRGDSVPDTANSARMKEMGGRMAYGKAEGQLGEMEAGDLDGIATSPPFEDNLNNASMAPPHDTTGNFRSDYGSDAGQLGNGRGETFWQAARDIVFQCAQVLRPGAVTAWVCKDFVRSKKRVEFCNDWCRLLEACGFEVFERWKMWQISEAVQPDLFGGSAPVKSQKGFFRRLAESKGSPRIDFEETIWARRLPLFQGAVE